MPELKCKKKTVIRVEYGDLEAFIKEIYGHTHEIVAAEEASNDSTLSFSGVGEYPEDYDEFDREDFAKWQESGKHWPWGTQTILEELCLAGLIEAGDYLVEIYW